MTLSRIIYAILLMITVYSAYYLYGTSRITAIQVTPDLELPALSGQFVDNTSFTEKGVRSYRVTSQYLDHYAKSGDTVFEYPVLYIYRDGETQEWEVTADRGVLTKDQVLTLYDNVLAKNLLPDASFDTMATQKLFIKLDNRDFWADTAVMLLGPTFETKGNAMEGNFADNVATLYNKVQGRYETLTP